MIDNNHKPVTVNAVVKERINWSLIKSGLKDIVWGIGMAVLAYLLFHVGVYPAAGYFTINAFSSYGLGVTKILTGFLSKEKDGDPFSNLNVPPIIDFIFMPGPPTSSINMINKIVNKQFYFNKK